MDYDINAIRLGLDYSQLTEAQKQALLACMHQYVPFNLWTDTMVRSWYVNRKITAVAEADDETRFYGLIPQVDKWRHVMTLKKTGEQEWLCGPLWQPLPIDIDVGAMRKLVSGLGRR